MNDEPKINNQESRQNGFTILELMIATMVFSVVLLLCATAIVQVGRMYYKTTLLVRTTDTARAVIDDVSQAIQFGNSSSSFFGSNLTGSVKSYCLGSIRYTYAPASASLGKNTAQGQTLHVLWKDRGGNNTCAPLDLNLPNPSAQGQELLGNDMRVSAFEVKQSKNVDGTPNPAGLWTINITIAYGSTNDLFTDSSNKVCINSIVGGQFCAVSTINTNAIKRL
jgi:prepilin-type N-terminal cleavage/methylation domain-containing protein